MFTGKRMRGTAVSLLTVICMAATAVSALAAEAIPYTIGTTVTGTRQLVDGNYYTPEDVWYSVKVESDGLYKVSNRSSTKSNYEAGGGRMEIYDNAGRDDFYLRDSGYTITPYSLNSFEEAFIEEYAVYLNKGDYLFKQTGGRDVNTYSFTVERISTTYGEDKEVNDTAAGAVALTVNGKAGGVLGGRRDDGSKDKYDFYSLQIPSAMTTTLHVLAGSAIGLTVYDSASKELKGANDKQTTYNTLEDVHKLDLEVELDAGTYYIRLASKYYQGFSDMYAPYLLTMGDGTGSGAAPAAKAAKAEPIETGLKITLPSPTTGIGFQVLRSDAPGAAGVVISELASGESFIDVNVEAGKAYYYTFREVFADGTLGEASTEVTATASAEVISEQIAGEKGFILMKIGSPNMSVNGAITEIDPGRGTVPAIQNGRTLVPIRAIIEAMNGTVSWNEAEKRISLDVNGHSIEMQLGSKTITVDGGSKEMDIAPDTINDRTMLPLRFVAENAECAIEWIGSTQEIVIVFAVG